MVNRFWSKVKQGDGCWEWQASKFHHGYGCFGVRNEDGTYRTSYAHRVSWEMANGPIPDGMFVLHKCDNRACVRPDHLWLGTQTDNMRDCSDKGRKPGIPKFGASNPGAKLTDAHVKIIRYVGNRLSQQRLADEFGVSQTLIGCVLRRKIWPHVEIA